MSPLDGDLRPGRKKKSVKEVQDLPMFTREDLMDHRIPVRLVGKITRPHPTSKEILPGDRVKVRSLIFEVKDIRNFWTEYGHTREYTCLGDTGIVKGTTWVFCDRIDIVERLDTLF